MSCPFSKGGTGRPVGRDGQRTGYPFSFSSSAAQKYSQEGHLTLDMMRVIMGEEKKSDLDRVTFTSDTLRKYFPKSYTPQRMQETIIKLLEAWQKSVREIRNDERSRL